MCASYPCRFLLKVSRCLVVRAFPNLRALRIHRCGSFTSTEAACWESLDSVEGPVEFFEQWSPTCHIPHVSISSRLAKPHFDTPSSATMYELKPTLCLIRKASPVALTLLIMADPGLTDSFWIPLTKCTPRLRSLEIRLYTFPEGDVMPRLFACKLLEQAPSVRCVSLSFTSCRRYFPHDTKTTAWKVVGARTCRKLERITEALEEDVQRRIIAPDFDPRTSL
ncbi:hypothetical protein IEO21_05782 [Rhodonia placenta]|uniref:Uncharacterized protein n=1 Tax=Rhodonia placenta TaxID=104341 RepID=A0A8H7U1Y0_9APHY|nr:hypothetical protein IEO21_05782 [Postia placenta]